MNSVVRLLDLLQGSICTGCKGKREGGEMEEVGKVENRGTLAGGA